MQAKTIPPHVLNQILSHRFQRRFWKRVDIRGEDECWNWTGFAPYGYGRISIGPRENVFEISVHRVVMVFELRDNLPTHLFALHSCIGNKRCCNPNHLRLGTQTENIADMDRQGRRVPAFGVRNGAAKLSPEKVVEIRRLYSSGNWTLKELAAKFGVFFSTIHKVVSGERWAQVV